MMSDLDQNNLQSCWSTCGQLQQREKDNSTFVKSNKNILNHWPFGQNNERINQTNSKTKKSSGECVRDERSIPDLRHQARERRIGAEKPLGSRYW